MSVKYGYSSAEQQITIQIPRMRVLCWKNKFIDTHSE